MKELHSLIEGKFGQVRQKKGLKKAIKAIGESLSSNSVDFEEILEAGPDNVIDCIRQIEDSSFWRPFRFFLGRLMGEGSANALEMHQRIWEELTRLAKLNAVNRRRIMWLIGLELTDEGILIDTAAKIKMDQP